MHIIVESISMKISIPYTNLDKQWSEIRHEALPLIDEILASGKYLDHELVTDLEANLARYVDCKEVILVNSGTDALMLALNAYGIGGSSRSPNSFLFKSFGGVLISELWI